MPTLQPQPTLADLQQYVRQLEQERGFDEETIVQACLLLGEEVGELFKSIRKSHAGLKMDTPGYDAKPDHELADVFILLCAVANRLGVDLERAFRDKEEINKQRTWS